MMHMQSIPQWEMDCICIIGHYNSLPMTTLWKTMVRFQDITVEGMQPLQGVVQYMRENNLVENFKMWCSAQSPKPGYESIPSNVLLCWGVLMLMVLVFAVVAVIALKFIDKDRR